MCSVTGRMKSKMLSKKFAKIIILITIFVYISYFDVLRITLCNLHIGLIY